MNGKLKLVGSQHKNSIDYVPASMDESIESMQDVVKEMELRKLPTVNKTVNQMRNEIRECLVSEEEMTRLVGQLNQAETRADAMEKIMQYVPCILHAENRIGIKIFTMFLQEALSNAQGDLINMGWDENSNLKQREQMFIEYVEKEVCNNMLGSDGNVAQWKVPVVSKKGQQAQEIGIINMENYHMRSIIEQLDSLIDKCITSTGENRQLKWKQILIHYIIYMKIMRKKGRITHLKN